MNRPRAYTIAAVLMLLLSLVAAITTLPDVAGGAPAAEAAGLSAPPYALTILNFIVAVLGFVAAYGIWRVEKWGVVFTIILCVVQALTSLPAIMFAEPLELRLFGTLGIVWSAAIIALLLRAGPRPVPA